MLVTDGKIQPGNLARSGQDEAWLRNLLSSEGHRPEDIYLAVLDTQGVLTLQLRRGDTVRIQAMDPSKVVW